MLQTQLCDQSTDRYKENKASPKKTKQQTATVVVEIIKEVKQVSCLKSLRLTETLLFDRYGKLEKRRAGDTETDKPAGIKDSRSKMDSVHANLRGKIEETRKNKVLVNPNGKITESLKTNTVEMTPARVQS